VTPHPPAGQTLLAGRDSHLPASTALLRDHDLTGLVPEREETVATISSKWLDHVGHRVKPTTLKRYRELLMVHVVPSIGPPRVR
jgi:hypothetical protein